MRESESGASSGTSRRGPDELLKSKQQRQEESLASLDLAPQVHEVARGPISILGWGSGRTPLIDLTFIEAAASRILIDRSSARIRSSLLLDGGTFGAFEKPQWRARMQSAMSIAA